MTIVELREELLHQTAPTLAYSTCRDGNADETYCLVVEADGWRVHYSERGARNFERIFESESAACLELMRPGAQ